MNNGSISLRVITLYIKSLQLSLRESSPLLQAHYAISLRFVNTAVFALDVTLDALLMTIIGGVGTLVGPYHWRLPLSS